KRCPFACQRRRPTRFHYDDQSHATTTAARLSSRCNSTFHQALRQAHGAGPTRQRDRPPPPRALGPRLSTWPDSLAGVQVAFFKFFQPCGGAHMEHPRGIANAARIHGPIDDLLLNVRRLAGLAILQEKGAPAPFEALPTAIPLLALPRHAMAHNIRALTVR